MRTTDILINDQQPTDLVLHLTMFVKSLRRYLVKKLHIVIKNKSTCVNDPCSQ